MMSNPATSHAAHDELLIARHFGDDVDERERAAALELVASCDECAALYADLGAIRDATVALPTPGRPRDFSLTEADAARLRPRRNGLGRVIGLGFRRSFGGALVAAGLAGVVFTSMLSTVPAGGIATALDQGSKAAVPEAAGSSNDYLAAGSPAVPNGGDISTSGGSGNSLSPTSAAAPATAVPTTGALAAETARTVTQPSPGGAGPVASPAPPARTKPPAPSFDGGTGSTGGPDVRIVAMAASGFVLAIGLLLLIGPRLRRRARG